MTWPLSSTMMRSAPTTVERRCAMMMDDRPFDTELSALRMCACSHRHRQRHRYRYRHRHRNRHRHTKLSSLRMCACRELAHVGRVYVCVFPRVLACTGHVIMTFARVHTHIHAHTHALSLPLVTQQPESALSHTKQLDKPLSRKGSEPQTWSRGPTWPRRTAES